VLVKAYPQLRDVPPFERGRWLFRKIEADMQAGLSLGLWAGLIAAMFPLPISIGTAALAGSIRRLIRKRASAGEGGAVAFSSADTLFEVALILGPVAAAPLAWTLITSGAGAAWRSFVLLAWTWGVCFLASRHRARYGKALWRRHGWLSAALAVSWLLAVARLWPEADAVIPWYVDAVAYALALGLVVRYYLTRGHEEIPYS
jgi:hypothetical protein